jgi:D-arabinose 1-dehydrogenase-like Zn-dependent alcohol dehydrogenase
MAFVDCFSISTYLEKFQDDAMKLGADEFVVTRQGFAKDMRGKVDLIIVCPCFHNIDD